jgi:capsular polysaccharide biosynthesis protein
MTEQFEICPSLPVSYVPPKTVQPNDEWIWKINMSEFRTHTHQLYWEKLNNVCINNNNGNIENRCNATFINDKCINLVDEWCGENYWHWLATGLARYCTLFYQNINGFNEYKVVVNSLRHKYVLDSLNYIGVKSENCFEAKNVCFRELINTSKIKNGDFPAFNFLRKRLGVEGLKIGSRKIYISRSGRRKIQNEKEFIDLVSEYGFETIYCEKLSFIEQINLFKDASVVIGAHGAGIGNILLSPNGIKVLEIRNRNFHGACYYKACNFFGMDYYNLYGVGNNVKSMDEFNANLCGDIQVNLEELEKTLEIMGI